MHAVARLALDPVIANIQASWVKMGPDGAALCLEAGANDMGGVLMDESITRAAGAVHGQEVCADDMERLIRAAGRMPLQRTHPVRRRSSLNAVHPLRRRPRGNRTSKSDLIRRRGPLDSGTKNRTIETMSGIGELHGRLRIGALDQSVRFPDPREDDADARSAPSPICATRASACRPSGSWPSPPACRARFARASATVDPDAAHPANLYRVNWYNDLKRTGQVAAPVHVELPEALTGVKARIVRGVGRAVPDDPGAQGAGRLRLPGAAPGRRPLRSDAPARRVALHRQLLPRRRGHLAHPRLPRRRRAAGRHEPGAVRLARPTG